MSLFSRLLSTPVRILNIPIKVAAKTMDAVADPRGSRRVQDYDPLALDQVADAIDDAVDQ